MEEMELDEELRPCPLCSEKFDRARLERMISAALRQCIDAHGPIDKAWIGSAAKRISGALKSIRQEIGFNDPKVKRFRDNVLTLKQIKEIENE